MSLFLIQDQQTYRNLNRNQNMKEIFSITLLQIIQMFILNLVKNVLVINVEGTGAVQIHTNFWHS